MQQLEYTAEDNMSTITQQARMRKQLLSVSIGNVMEWYDFAVFGGLIDAIAVSFFPASSADSSFFYALLVFSAAFVMRPVGGVVLGIIGDTTSRRKSLIVSMTLMLLPSVLIGCLPTYNQIGYASTILLLLCRLMQGFAGGGEMVGAIVYVVESTKDTGYSTYYGSICKATGNAGSTLGLGVVALIRFQMSEQQLYGWGWRLPFLASLIFGVVGMYLRANLVDDSEPLTGTDSRDTIPLVEKGRVSPPLTLCRVMETWKEILIVIVITSLWSVSYYSILVWLAYFLADPLQSNTTCISKNQVWILSFAMNCLIVQFMPLFGLLNDVLARGPMYLLRTSAALLTLLSCPLFLLIISNDLYQIVCGYLGFVMLISCYG